MACKARILVSFAFLQLWLSGVTRASGVQHNELSFELDRLALASARPHYAVKIAHIEDFAPDILSFDVVNFHRQPNTVLAVSKLAVVIPNRKPEFYSEELLSDPNFWASISKDQRSIPRSKGEFDSFIDIKIAKVALAAIPQRMQVHVISGEDLHNRDNPLIAMHPNINWQKIVILRGEGVNKEKSLRGSSVVAGIAEFGEQSTLIVSYTVIGVNISKLGRFFRYIGKTYGPGVLITSAMYTANQLAKVEL